MKKISLMLLLPCCMLANKKGAPFAHWRTPSTHSPAEAHTPPEQQAHNQHPTRPNETTSLSIAEQIAQEEIKRKQREQTIRQRNAHLAALAATQRQSHVEQELAQAAATSSAPAPQAVSQSQSWVTLWGWAPWS